MQDRIGVDVPDPPGHGLCLGKPHGGVQRLQLTVQIGESHGVAVHQRQLTHTGPGQTLCHVAAHAAQSEHDNVGGGQAGLPVLAPQHFISQKTLVHKTLRISKVKIKKGRLKSRPFVSGIVGR